MKTYFISDLHLNHRNIIKYTQRCFNGVEEMNREIVKKWNSVVGSDDLVYFVGDLCFGNPNYWLRKLNGTIIFLKGNHDKYINAPHNRIIKYKGKKFLLVHNPYYIPSNWNEWVIHGHVHNNNLEKYPVINKKNKTINVSCELLNYRPVEINEVMELVK